MSLWKRACLYSMRKRGKTITLFMFLLIMATLMLICLSIRSAAEIANANIKKALLGYFTVNAKQLDSGITEDMLGQILAIDGLSGKYTLRSYSYANYFDAERNPLEINTGSVTQIPEKYANAGKLVANSNTESDSYFIDAGFELTEGIAITSEQKNVVLLHEKFAERNGLSVGDRMFLGDVSDKSRAISVQVAGLFTNTKEQEAMEITPMYDLYDNIVFTDPATASYLLYGTEGETSVQYGDFYVNDPDNLEQVMAQVQEIKGVEWDECILTRYAKDYQNAKTSLAGLQNIVFIAIAIVSIISFLVLVLFLTLRLRGRIHETGIYLAMGVSKCTVLMQYLAEVFLVAAVALLMSYGTSAAISNQIGSTLLSQVTTDTYETTDLTGVTETIKETLIDLGLSEIKVSVSGKDYLAIWLFGMALCLGSTALAAYPIMKMKPKNTLSQMS